MRLFIAEKPSVARCIIDALGLRSKEKGYYIALNGDRVTWCFGHMLELAEPDHYLGSSVPVNSKNKKIWRYEDLPVFPQRWVNIPKSDKAARSQLTTIGKLIKACSVVVNCGDPDREGQLLVDEILEYFKYKKPALRYLSSAQDMASVRKALSSLKPNKHYEGMANAARARQRADWLIGMNLSRAFTLSAANELVSIGRVQTPTLNLVAARDKEIRSFVSNTFFKIKAQLEYDGIKFMADLDLDGLGVLDKSGYLTNGHSAQALLDNLNKCKEIRVTEVKEDKTELQHPLSLSLADIQKYAADKFGFSASKTLEVCQSLYETHRLTTYPRSDCSYLPEAQHKEAPDVLKALFQVNPDLSDLILKANPDIKSRTWNDSKITAHHGIIPTTQVLDKSRLSEDEHKIYSYIVRVYLAQFFIKPVVSTTDIKMAAGPLVLKASGSVLLRSGYRQVLNQGPTHNTQRLPACRKGDTVELVSATINKDRTRPPAAYNEGSLIKAMENISSTVSHPEHKKYLKDGDGIGTSATRAEIIEELKRKGYLKVERKVLKITDKALKFLTHLPDIIKNPVLTAIYECNFSEIEKGKMSISDFENKVVRPFVVKQVNLAKGTKIK